MFKNLCTKFNRIGVFIISLSLCIMLHRDGYAQAKIGDNPNIIHSKAILELDKTDKGFLPTRLTTAQMNAMFPTPDATAKGMTIYNIDSQCTYTYDGTIWKSMCQPNDNDWYMNSGATDQTYVSSNDSIVYRKGKVVIGSNFNNLNAEENLASILFFPIKEAKVYVNGDNGSGLLHFDTITKSGVGIGSMNAINPQVANIDFSSIGTASSHIGSVGLRTYNLFAAASNVTGTGVVENYIGDNRNMTFSSSSTGTTPIFSGYFGSINATNHAGKITAMSGIFAETKVNSPTGSVDNVYGIRSGIDYINSLNTSQVNEVQGARIYSKYNSVASINDLNGLRLNTEYGGQSDVGLGDAFAYFHGLLGIHNMVNISDGPGVIAPGHTVGGTRQELWYSKKDARAEPFYGSTNRMYVIYPSGSSIAGEPKLAIGYDVQMGPYAGSPGLFANAIGFMAGNRGRDTSIAYTIRFGQSENTNGNGVSFGYHVPVNSLYRLSGAKVRAFINEDVAVQSTFIGSVGVGIDGASRKLHVKDTGARTSVRLEDIPIYANDVAAGIGGLTTGDVYCTNVGGDLVLKIKI